MQGGVANQKFGVLVGRFKGRREAGRFPSYKDATGPVQQAKIQVISM
jgi:hypothetical protein